MSVFRVISTLVFLILFFPSLSLGGNLYWDKGSWDQDNWWEDLCPADPLKTEPGACGCGIPDTDTDNDATPDCLDNCPTDPEKTEPGVCGCGTPDSDVDGDGLLLCNDNCPLVKNPGQEDEDGDGRGDVCEVVGDLNHDGKVDLLDYKIIKTLLRKKKGSPGFDNEADINSDGVIDTKDLRLLVRLIRTGR